MLAKLLRRENTDLELYNNVTKYLPVDENIILIGDTMENDEATY